MNTARRARGKKGKMCENVAEDKVTLPFCNRVLLSRKHWDVGGQKFGRRGTPSITQKTGMRHIYIHDIHAIANDFLLNGSEL